MMPNKQTLLIVITAFALGFAVSDYRHKQEITKSAFGAQVAQVDEVAPAIFVSSVSSSSIKSAQSEPATINVSQSSSVGEKTTDVFSWVQVDQLIATARYDEAIRLLNTQMGNAKNSARAWFVLATIYKKQAQPIAAVDALFRYIRLEMDDQKIEKTLKDIRRYLIQLKETPALFNEDYSWLMGQFDELLKYYANDGDLHLQLAELAQKINDNYQAQYHALMAANDPKSQKSAELVLAKLNSTSAPDQITIPLTRYGNQFLVNVTIEGYAARLLVDTGASLSGLSNIYTAKHPDLIKAIKPIRINTAGGPRDSILFTVTSMSMESLVFNQHILAQLPMDNARGFDGLLGVDILGRFDFVIDQNAAVLYLKSRKIGNY